jgi:hypothetical protein
MKSELPPLNPDELFSAMENFYKSDSPLLPQGEGEDSISPLDQFNGLPNSDSIFQRDNHTLDTVSAISKLLRTHYDHFILRNFEPTFCKSFTQESFNQIAARFGFLTNTGVQFPMEGKSARYREKNTGRVIDYSIWAEEASYYSGSHVVDRIGRAVVSDGSYRLVVDGLSEMVAGRLRVFGHQLMLQRFDGDTVDAMLMMDATEESKEWQSTFLFPADTSYSPEFTRQMGLVDIRNRLIPGFRSGSFEIPERVR